MNLSEESARVMINWSCWSWISVVGLWCASREHFLPISSFIEWWRARRLYMICVRATTCWKCFKMFQCPMFHCFVWHHKWSGWVSSGWVTWDEHAAAIASCQAELGSTFWRLLWRLSTWRRSKTCFCARGPVWTIGEEQKTPWAPLCYFRYFLPVHCHSKP